jgi:hypothetical protein
MGSKPPRQLHASPENNQPEDDYKAASNAADIDFDQYMPKLRTEHKVLRRIVKIIVLVILIAGLGVIAYTEGPNVGNWFNSKSKAKVPSAPAVSSTIAAPSQQYSSSNQSLSFEYPAKWKVTEASEEITVKSNPLRLLNYNGKTITGQIVMTVQANNSNNLGIPAFNTGNPAAVLPSQLVNYKNPASDQLASTYISFLEYANAKGSGISVIYITGNTGYTLGQYSSAADIDKVSPIIGINFFSCRNNTCSGTTSPMTISTSSWSNTKFSSPLLRMLESFSI